MTRLLQFRPPTGLLKNLQTWLLADSTVGVSTVTIDGSDPPGLQSPADTTRALAMSIDYQQAASERTQYARLSVRCYVAYPDGARDYDGLQELAGAVLESLRRYTAKHGDVVSVDVDSGASITFDGSTAYALAVPLLTVPTH